MMDPQIIKYYRQLLRQGFPHIGKMDNPDIYIDSIGEKIQVCGSIARAYMHIYISVDNDNISKISYLCTCDPTANVVIEILSSLLEGRNLSAIESIDEDDLMRELGGGGEDFRKRARGTIDLVERGIRRYVSGAS